MPDDTTRGGLSDKGAAVVAEVLHEEGAKLR